MSSNTSVEILPLGCRRLNFVRCSLSITSKPSRLKSAISIVPFEECTLIISLRHFTGSDNSCNVFRQTILLIEPEPKGRHPRLSLRNFTLLKYFSVFFFSLRFLLALIPVIINTSIWKYWRSSAVPVATSRTLNLKIAAF